MKKREALAVARKFGMEERSGRETFFKLRINGILVLTTSVPKGQGEIYVANQFRQQLKLSETQLADAIRCPFGRSEYLEHLRSKGLIPSE